MDTENDMEYNSGSCTNGSHCGNPAFFFAPHLNWQNNYSGPNLPRILQIQAEDTKLLLEMCHKERLTQWLHGNVYATDI